ncbi:hypothetical protein G6F56_011892 [Rhizopus delemar]|nr:hypothetical protein G6F56_011892 [Rhizopus delemar]
MTQSVQQHDMTNLAHRLKARLALANFKREHGYESVDLLTLESSLLERVTKQPTTISLSKLNIYDKKRKRLLSHHRFYPTSPPLQSDRMLKRHAPWSPSHVPISDTRLRPYYEKRKLSATLSSDDEDAAHLLVMMHHSPTMS